MRFLGEWFCFFFGGGRNVVYRADESGIHLLLGKFLGNLATAFVSESIPRHGRMGNKPPYIYIYVYIAEFFFVDFVGCYMDKATQSV